VDLIASRSAGATTGCMVRVTYGVFRMKSATRRRCSSMLGVRTRLPAGKVTGLTLGSSILSPLEKRLPMSRKGEASTLARTFLIAVQIVSDRSNFGSLSEAERGAVRDMV